ncbi:hypothetical protein A1O3_03398 [Capronia epimyces CBS 606.96]|uniref:Uncharacterized protein n=1 Tax=Capronia epimyces CBS 606.96 TaxID=1182542 RepID=W9Y0X5_9EURO|nr:uncharacterized protein A1O3_03398 [Capronia epimyces CBS 606.96]EXJ86447.1 hypothetical protein A1O3_03398 [Capronia epimyces CBS 606.96]
MAGNQYRQQWQQGSAPVQQAYHYDRRDDQRQWQESGRSQKSHNQQEYQGYNGYPKGRNDYGQGLVSTPSDDYEQNWQWQGQDQYSHDGYQSQYADKRNGHPQAPSSDPYSGPDHPSNRTYQYDDRYRNNGHRRPPVEPEFSGSSNGQRPPQHQRPDPSSPHKRSKPRHRILAEPTSPKNLAWDNPFGAFPGKKRPDGKERRASIDNSLGNLTKSLVHDHIHLTGIVDFQEKKSIDPVLHTIDLQTSVGLLCNQSIHYHQGESH